MSDPIAGAGVRSEDLVNHVVGQFLVGAHRVDVVRLRRSFNSEPLPQINGVVDPGSAGASYHTWVDQFDTFGLARNVPINTGNARLN